MSDEVKYLEWAFDPQLKAFHKDFPNSDLPCLLHALVEIPGEKVTVWNATSTDLEGFHKRLEETFDGKFQWEAPYLHASKLPRFFKAIKLPSNDNDQS